MSETAESLSSARRALARLRLRPDLLLRTASAIALGLPTVLFTLWGELFFSFWVGGLGLLTALEWNRIAYGSKHNSSFALHLGGLTAILILSASGEPQLALIAILITLVLGLALAHLERFDPVWISVGTFYLLLPALSLLWLRQSAVEPAATVIWLFAVVWTTDIAALFFGQALGGPRLAPKLSPAKTWTGLIGAVMSASLIGLCGGWWLTGLVNGWLAVLAGLLAVISQLGDLSESAFKRRFGVKDSGRLIPGQGGLLDRVDGLIFAALAAAGLALLRGGDVLLLSMHP